jgi:hypothetical protein
VSVSPVVASVVVVVLVVVAAAPSSPPQPRASAAGRASERVLVASVEGPRIDQETIRSRVVRW